jgi:hypothetical protein
MTAAFTATAPGLSEAGFFVPLAQVSKENVMKMPSLLAK